MNDNRTTHISSMKSLYIDHQKTEINMTLGIDNNYEQCNQKQRSCVLIA